MKRLANREFWDARHSVHADESARQVWEGRGRTQRLRDKLRLKVGAWPGDSYAEYTFRKTAQRFLPRRGDWSILEVGSAPGKNLVDFHRLFGYDAFGVDYSPIGAEETRQTLKSAGLDPRNVIQADFFDTQFKSANAERFHVLLSCGFIEHFDDPAKVIRDHVNLLRNGGYLVCTIPNLRSYGYPFLALFGRDLLRVHNCKIMRLGPYRGLFEGLGLEPLFCSYVGVCQLFGQSIRHESSLRGHLARVLDLAGDVLDHLMFLVFRGRAPETRWSPHLVYIGRKRPKK